MNPKTSISRRKALSLTAAGLAVLAAGCSEEPSGRPDEESGTERPSRETVVETGDYDRSVTYFEAERGDLLEVAVDNDAGFRTHALINGPDNGILLSEGVEDQATFEVPAERTGTYKATMTPHDGSASTSGSMTVVLIHGAANPADLSTTEPDATTREPTPASSAEPTTASLEQVNEELDAWLAERENAVKLAKGRLEQGEAAYQDERFGDATLYFSQSADEYGDLSDAASERTSAATDPLLETQFGRLAEYFDLAREAADLRSDAAAAMADGDESSATELRTRSDESLSEAEATFAEIEGETTTG